MDNKTILDGTGTAFSGAADELGDGSFSPKVTLLDGSGSATPLNIARPDTGTQTSVAGSASDVTILAANAGRKGATVFNDSTAILYLLLGAGTSSTSVYSVKMNAGDYFEVPFDYTGIIKGIWASATGNARVTEMTTV